MNKTLAVSLLLMLAGCEGYYRYPCQDPANWGKLECNNDVCKAEGTCTSIVLARAGTLPSDGDIEPIDTDASNSISSEPSTDSENSSATEQSGINNTTCTPTAAVNPSYGGKGSQPRDFRVKNKMIAEPNNDNVDQEVIETIDNAAETSEIPLTMNTVVDTAAHNAATR